MRAFEALAKYLSEERTGHPVFGLMGDANLAYLGAFIEREGGHYVTATLEGGAVSMGDGWARTTGNVAVVSVTHGPALTNTLTSLIEATKAHTPMVLLTGSTPEVNEHFQYFDIEGFARLAGTEMVKVRRAVDLEAVLDRAFIRAASGQIPVVVDVPYDILSTEVGYRAPRLPEVRDRSRWPDPESVDEALGLLLSAKRPLILAGRGAVISGAREELLELARAINAPVMTSLLAKDYFDGEPENLGLHGTFSTQEAISYMTDVDVVISFGASLNQFTTDNFDLLRDRIVIQIDLNPAALSRFGPATHTVGSDARQMAKALMIRLREADVEVKYAAYMDTVANSSDCKDQYDSTTGNGYIDMRDASRWLNSVLPPGAQQVCDLGRFMYSTWPHITVDPERWIYMGSFGSIGLGTAAAVGAATARQEVPTALYVGDGGAMQGLVELNTAVRNKLPLIVMVLNDQCYGAEYLKLQISGSSPEPARVSWPSFAEVARGMGAKAVRATSLDDLEGAAEAVRTGQFPLLIEVRVDPANATNRPGLTAATAD